MRDVILALASAPDSQIDVSITERLRNMADSPTAAEMEQIIKDCCYGSLASDFAMFVMGIVWEHLKKKEASA